MKHLVLVLILVCPWPAWAQKLTVHSAMNGKVRVEVHYNPVTLAITQILVINDSNQGSRPVLKARTPLKVELANGDVVKGNRAFVIAPGQFMIRDPETNKPLPPFEIELNLPFGTDQ